MISSIVITTRLVVLLAQWLTPSEPFFTYVSFHNSTWYRLRGSRGFDSHQGMEFAETQASSALDLGGAPSVTYPGTVKSSIGSVSISCLWHCKNSHPVSTVFRQLPLAL